MRKIRTHKKIFCWFSLLGMCVTIPAFPLDGHWYIGAGYGKSLAHVSNNTPDITYYSGYLTDSYPLTNSEASAGVTNLTGGYEWSAIRPGWPAIAVGLGVYTTPNAYDYQGQVNETPSGGAGYTLYDYQFQLNSTRFMAETTFTWTVAQHWTPYAELGVGMAFNKVSNYTETVADTNSNGYVVAPPFESNTSDNFSYQAGLGLGYDFNFDQYDFDKTTASFQHERLKTGYRWVNLGSASTGTRGASYPYALDLGTVTTQELYVSFTHFF